MQILTLRVHEYAVNEYKYKLRCVRTVLFDYTFLPVLVLETRK